MQGIIILLDEDDGDGNFLINEGFIFEGLKSTEEVEKKIEKEQLDIDLEDAALILSVNDTQKFEVLQSASDVEITIIK